MVKRVSSSSSCGDKNSSSTTHFAGNTAGRAATAALVSDAVVVRTRCGEGGCGSPGVRNGSGFRGSFTGPGDGGCGSPGVRIGGCGSLRGTFTPGEGGCGSPGV